MNTQRGNAARKSAKTSTTPAQRRRANGDANRQATRMQAQTRAPSVRRGNSAYRLAIQPSLDMLSDAREEPAILVVPTPSAANKQHGTREATAETSVDEALLEDEDSSAAVSLPASPRLPPRTRTLADVVQPPRSIDPQVNLPGSADSASQPSDPSQPSVPESAPPSDPGQSWLPTPSSARASGVGMRPKPPFMSANSGFPRSDAEDQARADVSPVIAGGSPASARTPVKSIPMPRASRTESATQPVAAVDVADEPSHGPIEPVTRPRSPWRAPRPHDDEETLRRFVRGARRGSPRLATNVAVGHAIAGVVLAVMASALVLAGHPLGPWLLGLAGSLVAAGGTAYLLVWWRQSARLALVVLVAAQMSALTWGCVLIGPRAALVVLAVPAVGLALRAGGRWPAAIGGAGLVAVYLALLVATGLGLKPIFALTDAQLVATDAVSVGGGIALLLVDLFAAASTRERSEAEARARLFEVRHVRGQIGALRTEVERDGQVLDEALDHALRGRGVEPIDIDGPLSLLAQSVNTVAERLRTLQKDREDRLRLEGAVRALARALERGWLGLPWMWPAASGSMLDEVVAMLRTPRPVDAPTERHASPASAPSAPVTSRSQIARDDVSDLRDALSAWSEPAC